jgi:hypothetical protein
MSMWRRLGGSGILMVVIGLAILPGCGGGSGNTTGPNPEIEVVPPRDASGKIIPVTDDAGTTAKRPAASRPPAKK